MDKFVMAWAGRSKCHIQNGTTTHYTKDFGVVESLLAMPHVHAHYYLPLVTMVNWGWMTTCVHISVNKRDFLGELVAKDSFLVEPPEQLYKVPLLHMPIEKCLRHMEQKLYLLLMA